MKKILTLKIVADLVIKESKVDIFDDTRDFGIIKYRQLAVRLMHENTIATLKDIGTFLAKKRDRPFDHATIKLCITTCKKKCDTDLSYRKMYECLRSYIKDNYEIQEKPLLKKWKHIPELTPEQQAMRNIVTEQETTSFIRPKGEYTNSSFKTWQKWGMVG